MIEIKNIKKAFKEKTVLNGINMKILDGELVTIIGPSGCGKTTLLRMINRLIKPTSGNIFIDRVNVEDINKVALRRKIGYVIQQMGLFPHMTVRENIELIQKLEKKDFDEISDNTIHLMDVVGLDAEEFLDRYPTELSGGQQQRVGVARALAAEPKLILMDEPFSALDPVTRLNLQDELIQLHEKMKMTILFVTHDMDEAIKISDKICIMNDGHILQYDTPENILKNPYNEYVENFVGKNRIWASPEYIKVSDIMIENPITCPADLPMKQCVKRMQGHHVDSLVVIDDQHGFLGVIDNLAIRSTKNPLAQAHTIMEHGSLVARSEDTMVQLLKLIDEKHVDNIPVVNDEDKLVGLITKSNLVGALSQQYLNDDEEAEMSDGEEELL